MNPFVFSPAAHRTSPAAWRTVAACCVCMSLSCVAFAADGDTPAKVVPSPAIPAATEAEKDIAKNPIIKHLVGEWEAKGELTAPDGNVITIKEEWKGTVVSANTFAIEGKRVINSEESVYKWTITQNPDTGVYEAMHVINNGETQRFEGNFSEPNFSVEWVAQLDGGSTIKLVESFTGEAKDAFDTEVTFTNGKGETTLSGKIANKKVR
jgi:hypothetical protein